MQQRQASDTQPPRPGPVSPAGGEPPAVDPGPAAGDQGSGPVSAGGQDPGSAPAGGHEELRFRVTSLSIVYRYLFLGLLTLLGLVFLYVVVPMSLASRDYLIVAIEAVWALALLRYWVQLLDMPTRIVLKQGAPVEFSSVLRTRRIQPAEIQAFRVSPVYPSFLKIVTKGKKTVSLINHISGLNVLIGRVRQANPDLETKGC